MIRTVRKSLTVLEVLLVAVIATAFNEAAAAYPRDPCSLKKHFYAGGSGLSKYSAETNRLVWSILNHLDTFEPLCTADTVFIGSRQGLYAVNPESGAVLWSRSLPLYSPNIEGAYLYVAGPQGQLQKYRADSGELIWTNDYEGWVYPPVVIDGRVIAGGKAHVLLGVDAADGRVLWQRNTGQELVYRPVAAQGSTVVIATYRPEVMAIDAQSGDMIWSRTEGSAPYTPAVFEQQLYYGDQDGVLHAVDARTGRQLWHRDLPGAIRSVPAIGSSPHDTVWVGTDSGLLAALDRHSGRILWQKQLDDPILHSPMPLAGKVYLRVGTNKVAVEHYSLPSMASQAAGRFR
jgi:outer membrane protein assembly factor BamB